MRSVDHQATTIQASMRRKALHIRVIGWSLWGQVIVELPQEGINCRQVRVRDPLVRSLSDLTRQAPLADATRPSRLSPLRLHSAEREYRGPLGSANATQR